MLAEVGASDEHPLLREFQQFLGTSTKELSISSETNSIPTRFDQVAEFNALKTEVKRNGRQFKEAIEHFKSALEGMDKSQDILRHELEQRRDQEQSLRREILRPLLLSLLELYDRMAAGAKACPPKPGGIFGRFHGHQGKWIAAMQEGQQMSLRRLDQLLEEYQVVPIEVFGKRLDPNTMRVVDVESRAGMEDGVVTEELRKGFLWNEQLLRTAEVRVNKSERNG